MDERLKKLLGNYNENSFTVMCEMFRERDDSGACAELCFGIDAGNCNIGDCDIWDFREIWRLLGGKKINQQKHEGKT
jgi:hypothetical protein